MQESKGKVNKEKSIDSSLTQSNLFIIHSEPWQLGKVNLLRYPKTRDWS